MPKILKFNIIEDGIDEALPKWWMTEEQKQQYELKRGKPGPKWEPGKSAFDVAKEMWFEGDEQEYLDSMRGRDWEDGEDWEDGKPGKDGEDAYTLAVRKWFNGTEEEWLDSLHGKDWEDGKSAYEIAVKRWFKGSMDEWLESLRGKDAEEVELPEIAELEWEDIVDKINSLDENDDSKKIHAKHIKWLPKATKEVIYQWTNIPWWGKPWQVLSKDANWKSVWQDPAWWDGWVAADSERLGWELPSFYVTQTDLATQLSMVYIQAKNVSWVIIPEFRAVAPKSWVWNSDTLLVELYSWTFFPAGITASDFAVNQIAADIVVRNGIISWVDTSAFPPQTRLYVQTNGTLWTTETNWIAGMVLKQHTNWTFYVNITQNTAFKSDLALTEKIANKWVAWWYTPLNSSSQVDAIYLPSYVDDVINTNNYASLPPVWEIWKIYVTIDNNNIYRWSWSTYIQIVASPWSTDAVTEWTSNLYFTYQRVRDTVLTWLSLVSWAVISATDTVMSALWKLQKQITTLDGTVLHKTWAEEASWVKRMLDIFKKRQTTNSVLTNDLWIGTRYEISWITYSNSWHIMQILRWDAWQIPEWIWNDWWRWMEFWPHWNPYLAMQANDTRIWRTDWNTYIKWKYAVNAEWAMKTIYTLTQAQYDAIATKDANTIYMITA